MALVLDIINYDRQLAELPFQPVFLNNFDVNLTEEKKKLNSFIMSVYYGDTLDITPQCSCGEIHDGEYLGVMCPNCRTPVTYPAEQEIQSTVWARVPDGIHAFINPQAYIVLANDINVTGFDTMRWFIDSGYRHLSRKPIPLKVYLEQQFEILGIKRGINSFVQHFDTIMQLVLEGPSMRGPKFKEKVDTLREFLRLHKHKFFSEHIAFPSSTMFVIESTATGRYADSKIEGAIDAINILNSVYHPSSPMSLRKKENWVAKALLRISEYYVGIYKDVIGRKKGLVRKHMLGTLHPWTTRTVISSVTANHKYDELEFPYAPSALTYKEHLLSKLMWRGYCPQTARRFVAEHTRKFHPLMKTMFQELIDESPHRGIPGGFVRNPSLDRNSNQFLYTTKIKDDPRDNTIGLSVLILKGYNADFDGDAMNHHSAPDAQIAANLERFSPHLGIMDNNVPFKVSGKLAHQSPVVSTMDCWMNEFVEGDDSEPYHDELEVAQTV